MSTQALIYVVTNFMQQIVALQKRSLDHAK